MFMKTAKHMAKRKHRKGFTMIELIVVIAILAILAAIAIPAYNNVQQGARDSTDRANATIIVKTANMYNSLAATANKVTAKGQLAGKSFNLSTTGTNPDLVTMTLDHGVPSGADFTAALQFIDPNLVDGQFVLLNTRGA